MNVSELDWIFKRLKVMSLREICTMRLWREGRDAVWKPGRRIPSGLSLRLDSWEEDIRRDFQRHFPHRTERAVERAEQLLENRIVLFDREFQFSDPPDWHRDHITGKTWPAGGVDYRNSGIGDPKDVWELNRHQFLPVLGKACFLTGEDRFGRKALDWMESWMDQNPPFRGINWKSGIEMALRAASWLWTLKFLQDSSLLTEERMKRVTICLYRHGCWIDAHLSFYSSANNHLISELFALVILGTALNRDQWISKALAILTEQIDVQVLADGVGAEQSPSYLAHTLEFSALASLACRQRGMEIPEKILRGLERGGRFLQSIQREDGSLPWIGDSDSGRVLDLGEDRGSTGTLINLIGFLTRNDRMLQSDVKEDEKLFWLLGTRGFEEVSRKADETLPGKTSAFPVGGIFILERIHGDDRMRAVFDCGPLGLKPLAGHGHADALSLLLDLNGEPVLIDPGTYTYFKSRFWRDYFRGTSAHNTIRVDGVDQSVFGGLFLALEHNRAECREWIPGKRVTGRSFGYQRLKPGVVHTRTLEMRKDQPELIIEDVLDTEGRHRIEIFFHLAPRILIRRESDRLWIIDFPGKQIGMELDPKPAWEIRSGDDQIPSGWISPVYGRKDKTRTLIGSAAIAGPECFTSRIYLIN